MHTYVLDMYRNEKVNGEGMIGGVGLSIMTIKLFWGLCLYFFLEERDYWRTHAADPTLPIDFFVPIYP